jgi:trigger factor
MQVSVEQLNALERRLTVRVPADQIEPQIEQRLKSLSPQVKLHGFRPGKVPFKMIKRLYGSKVRQEVVSEVLQNSFRDALAQEKLRPVGAPRIEPGTLSEQEGLEYSAFFEVMPEFEVQGIETIRVERPVVDVTEADIDALIDRLRWQRVTWTEVERPAQLQDRMTLDFQGTINGIEFLGGRREDAQVMLGSHTFFFKDLEDRLLGLAAGTETDLEVTFPQDYSRAEFAGRAARFHVKVKAVVELRLPEVDEAFAALFHVTEGGVEELRRRLRATLERQARNTIAQQLRQHLRDGLLAANDIPLPQAMVDAQVDALAKQMGLPVPDEEIAPQDESFTGFKTGLLVPEARRQIAFGLLLSRLAESQALQVDEDRVRNRLLEIAADYEDPAGMLQNLEQNREQMQIIRNLTLEDQVVDWLLEQVQIVDRPTGFAELVQGSADASTAVQSEETPDNEQ